MEPPPAAQAAARPLGLLVALFVVTLALRPQLVGLGPLLGRGWATDPAAEPA